MAQTVKNEVLYRVYFVLFGLILPIAGLLVYKTVDIAVLNGAKWREEGQNSYVRIKDIQAERGNILSADGSLLATSLPFFDIAFDPNSSGMSEEAFVQNIDSLSYMLATHVDNSYTPGGMKQYLLQKRAAGAQYIPIKKNASYSEMRFIAQFPLFERGQFKGGFIAKPTFKRKLPFGILANRTIGSIREGALPVGIEGFYDETLRGEVGKQPMQRVDIPNDIWLPLEDLTAIEPKRGLDVVTTIDINLQDISENALVRAMNHHDADWGTAVVMEVETGAIRAIANIGKTPRGWWETYNHAVGSATEPGSTFKLASVMALLEDDFVALDDTVHIKYGKYRFFDDEMVDATAESTQLDTTTVRRAFEISSNVGIARLTDKYYRDAGKATQLIERLKQFGLDLPTGIEIAGEAQPFIKEPGNREQQWSGTTIPWMSIGYELLITPLQLLNFYNTVANDGRMMKPYLVAEVQENGETVLAVKPTVIQRKIASESTLRQVHELLVGVVEQGTAKKLKAKNYQFAGKTGTAQRNYQRIDDRTTVEGYQASFAGYFPARRPIYSCIVVINGPRRNGFYGGDVAGPVFREIADKAFVTKPELRPAVNVGLPVALTDRELPYAAAGYEPELAQLLDRFELPHIDYADAPWAMLRVDAAADSLQLLNRSLPETTVPNVVGMGLRDAIYVLENRGLSVRFSGYGRVVRQSIRPGTRIVGQEIRLTLD